MAFLPLDGPALQDQINLSSTTVFRVKVGTEELAERDVVTILPMDGLIWIFFGDGNLSSPPSASVVKSKGFPQPKGSMRSYEASGSQEIYIVADTGTVDVRFAERG